MWTPLSACHCANFVKSSPQLPSQILLCNRKTGILTLIETVTQGFPQCIRSKEKPMFA
jgi:hypothetical protein